MNILFVVGCSFPTGEASSIRALNLIRLFNLCKHNIYVICDYEGESCENVPCTYEALNINSKSLINREKIARYSIKAVINYCSNNHVDIIVMNAKADRCNGIINYAKKKKIKVIIENCEWYHFGNYKLKLLDYRYWRNQKMMYIDFHKADGFISISRLLNTRNSNIAKSIIIPTILDTETISYRIKKNHDYPINLVYTGNPGISKELLAPIINVLSNNRELNKKIVLNIYGVDRKRLLKNRGVTKKALDMAGDSIIIHGRVSQKLIPEILYNSDYLIFIRPIRKSSNAGFPTKLGESMAAGTPIISNITGDINVYVDNNVNGFLFEKYDYIELERILDKITKLNDKEYENMRKMARRTAENFFDYRKYKSQVDELFYNK